MGAPHFVDFGKNMEHSPDGKAYLVAQGAEENDPMPRFSNTSWMSADQVYLSRVTPSPETINDEDFYEYFAGHNENGEPIWTKDFESIKPLLDWNNHMGCVTVTYNAPLKKYFMCVTDGWRTRSNMDSYILEADKITGPWKIITYMKEFGTQAYFLNFPSKFISEDGKTMWLAYSGNYGAHRQLPRNPPHGRYGFCMYEIKLLGDEKHQIIATKAFEDSKNIAPMATVTSQRNGQSIEVSELTNGQVDDKWTANENSSEIKFTWDEPQIIHGIRMFNHEKKKDVEKFGHMELSNGRKIPFRLPLPNTEFDGLHFFWGNDEEVDWIKIVFESVKPSTERASLAEVCISGVSKKK